MSGHLLTNAACAFGEMGPDHEFEIRFEEFKIANSNCKKFGIRRLSERLNMNTE